MNILLVATTNKGKIREINFLLSKYFSDLKVISLDDIGITISPEETGKTFLDNSVEKAVFYSKKRKGTVTLADDSGLAVESLNGLPGIMSARFSGEDHSDDKNIEKLLNELSNKKNRNAKFVSVITLAKDGKVIKSFTGEVFGTIIDEKRGENGFGYDPVFYYKPLSKTFAELSEQEKNRISHRAVALNKLKDYLLSLKENI